MTQTSLPRIVDVFVGKGALGNPAAVVTCPNLPPEDEMQRQAARIGTPATAFVDGSDAVRWFSPDHEIALCGHGALAVGHVLIGAGKGDKVALRTRDGGVVSVRRLSGDGRYEVGLPEIRTAPKELHALAGALRVTPLQIRWNEAGYVLAILETAQEVREIAPDIQMLAALGNWQVSVSAPGDIDGADIVSRVFSGGGKEDAATGSAHAALAPYWCERLGRDRITAYQASQRGGWLDCGIGPAGTIHIGGAVRDQRSG
ncbi:putative isomerase yddE, PhzC-PhzF family [Altererythrobacter epoxidivorans]|uniref:Putative isomerase yddE, PhzC-PhzF family n=1 Tax=Altererythrobacter epoxidivorans TaxID=361183 RepID=A0A0M4LXF9_9SPHN|nr:PhzF family phenazine biosynthesis protein [Altererythrobacter epoxidivorans]ALE17897.1 putative isomerase yddE, PhzC-PhzF family [Altererythrobacter epoxidivorans]